MATTDSWDVVPYAKDPMDKSNLESIMLRKANDTERFKRQEALQAMRKSFFYAHNQYQSSVKFYQTRIYELTTDVGLVDAAIVGSILLHLRDPFLALQKVAEVTKETIIVSDLYPQNYSDIGSNLPFVRFLPDQRFTNPWAWWGLTPKAVERMLFTLGFEVSEQTSNSYYQTKYAKDIDVWTLVAHRVRV